MKITALLFPALLLMGGTSLLLPADAAGLGVVDDGPLALEFEYDAAVVKWKAAIEKASRDERKVLRKAKPAIDFWPRFQTLADAGNGRALLWLATHVRDKGVKSRERAAVLQPLYSALARDHCNAEWFGEVLQALPRDSRILGQETVLDLYETVIAKTNSDESRAGALYQASVLLTKSDDETSRKRGEAYLTRVESEFPKTSWGMKARAAMAVEAVQVGKMAPDFTGETIDNFKFDLSDYKGKVVLLDFYGFW